MGVSKVRGTQHELEIIGSLVQDPRTGPQSREISICVSGALPLCKLPLECLSTFLFCFLLGAFKFLNFVYSRLGLFPDMFVEVRCRWVVGIALVTPQSGLLTYSTIRQGSPLRLLCTFFEIGSSRKRFAP